MGEEDPSIFAKAQLGWHPASPAENPGANAARARWKQSAALRHLPDRHVDMGAGPALPRDVRLARCPGLFSSAGAVLVGILRGRASRHCSRGSEAGGEREIRGPS